MEIWPNFFIVGAPKAGTTSLYEYLKNIPGIYMSPVKEPNYFSLKASSIHTIHDKQKYLKLFEKAGDVKVIGEASPYYLHDLESPKLIHQVSPNARILISLRDPVERAYSAFLMEYGRGVITNSFSDQLQIELCSKIAKYTHKINLLKNGLYYKYVKRYLDIFGARQMKIIIFENWINDPRNTVQEILDFLGVKYIVAKFESKSFNPYQAPRGQMVLSLTRNKAVKKISKTFIPVSAKKFVREKFLMTKQPKPKMKSEDKKLLINFYRRDVQNLQNLLGYKFPWRNFQEF